MLDEFAERLRGNVDAAEELSSPPGAAALQDLHLGVAELAQPGLGLRREPLVAPVEDDDRHVAARHEVVDHHLQARERRRAGEERVAAVVHPLLAHVEERELLRRSEPRLQLVRTDSLASRMSECGGKIFQAPAFASKYSRWKSCSSARPYIWKFTSGAWMWIECRSSGRKHTPVPCFTRCSPFCRTPPSARS